MHGMAVSVGVVDLGCSTTGTVFHSIENIDMRRCIIKAASTIKEAHYPDHALFLLLPLGWRHRSLMSQIAGSGTATYLQLSDSCTKLHHPNPTSTIEHVLLLYCGLLFVFLILFFHWCLVLYNFLLGFYVSFLYKWYVICFCLSVHVPVMDFPCTCIPLWCI